MKVIWTSYFINDVTFYMKKKKYTKIHNDVNGIVKELEKGNLVGDRLDNIALPSGAVYKSSFA